MKPRGKLARLHAPLLVSLAHVSTVGVTVSIVRSAYAVPCCFGNARVCLPRCLLDNDMQAQLRRTWRHELQHARDLLDGIDLPLEEMEQRARSAELLP